MTLQLSGAYILLTAAADPNATPDQPNYFITLAIGIALFVLMIFGARFLLKWLAKRPLPKGAHIKILDRISVMSDCTLMLVSVAGKVVLIGVSKEKTSFLCELDSDEMFDENVRAAASAAAFINKDGADADDSFIKRFTHNMKLAAGVMPKDAQPMRPHGSNDRAKTSGASAETGHPKNTQGQGSDDRARSTGDKPDPELAGGMNERPVQSAPGGVRPIREKSAEPKLPANYQAAIDRVKQLSDVDGKKRADNNEPEPSGQTPKRTGTPGQQRPAARFAPKSGTSPENQSSENGKPESEERGFKDVLGKSMAQESRPNGPDMQAKADSAGAEAAPLIDNTKIPGRTKPAHKDIDNFLDLVASRKERYSSKSGGGGGKNPT